MTARRPIVEVAPPAHSAHPAPKKGAAAHAPAPVAVAVPAAPVKKEKRKKDPNAPKKPMSAFFCFQMARRNGLKHEAPELNHKDIIKVSNSNLFFLEYITIICLALPLSRKDTKFH